VPVLVGLPGPPLTAIFTVNGCVVVMLDEDGVTVTSGESVPDTDTSIAGETTWA
jgi:hypothetical protein